jgi:hypothetical protein
MTDTENDVILSQRIGRAIDVAKHISTLAAGSLVLVATFLDKRPKPVVAAYWLVSSLVCLCMCILACFLYLFLLAIPSNWEQGWGGTIRDFWKWLTLLALVTYATFCAGIFCLAVFAVLGILGMPK